MIKPERFHKATVKCKSCGEVIISEWGGHFVSCKCGKTYVDQERFAGLYYRIGGEGEDLGQVCPPECNQQEHKNNKKL